MNKRIILVGPSASGKNYLRERYVNRGFSADVSYTTRDMRPGEKDGKDYHFIDRGDFQRKVLEGFFYEWTEYKGNLYGTSLEYWNTRDIFIMETHGISLIKPEDRKTCFIIYLDPPTDTRIKRMCVERDWKWDFIAKRLDFDKKCFEGFSDYDMVIKNPEF